MGVRVVTDSTSYLPADVRERLGISVVSLAVSFGADTQREEDVDPAEFYARLRRERVMPVSSQPAPGELRAVFEAAARGGDDILGVFISSEMSGTFDSAAQIAEEVAAESAVRAVVIDSRSNCMQLGMAVIAGAESAAAGEDVDACAMAARGTMERTRFLFVPHDLEYLRRGGRIGGASALLGTMLNIRPILTVADGRTDVYRKVRSKRRALETIVAAVAEDGAAFGGLDGVVVHHIDDEEDARATAALLREQIGVEPRLLPLGPVIGLHVGPGTVGVVYRTVQPLRDGGESE